MKREKMIIWTVTVGRMKDEKPAIESRETKGAKKTDCCTTIKRSDQAYQLTILEISYKSLLNDSAKSGLKM